MQLTMEGCFINLMSAGCPIVMDKTILVVEDQRLSRIMILNTLTKKYGLQCIAAEDGREALKLLKSNEVGLILTDLRMPVLDGLELIKVIREGAIPLKVSRDIPIVVLSAEEGAMLDDARKLQISGCFIKKEPIDSLVPKLRELLKID